VNNAEKLTDIPMAQFVPRNDFSLEALKKPDE